MTATATESAIDWNDPRIDARYPKWFRDRIGEKNPRVDIFERIAYRGYISYGISMTDGHYAPECFENWLFGFRKDPLGALYQGNDSQTILLPFVLKYIRKIRKAEAKKA